MSVVKELIGNVSHCATDLEYELLCRRTLSATVSLLIIHWMCLKLNDRRSFIEFDILYESKLSLEITAEA